MLNLPYNILGMLNLNYANHMANRMGCHMGHRMGQGHVESQLCSSIIVEIPGMLSLNYAKSYEMMPSHGTQVGSIEITRTIPNDIFSKTYRPRLLPH